MKNILKGIIFFIILNIIFYYIGYTMILKHAGYNAIDYFKDNDKLDIIWLGSSTTHTIISPMYIWNKYNIASFNNAYNGHRLTSFYLLKDMEKYNPKLIFFDITMLLEDSFISHNFWEKKLFQWFLSTPARFEYIKDTSDDFKNSYYMFLLNYFHTRWKNITEEDFINNKKTYYFMGGLFLFDNNPQNKPTKISGKYPLNQNTVEMINKMAKYIKDNNLNVVFICFPTAQQVKYEQSFLFEDVAKKYDIDYINLNKIIDTLDLDYSKDFRDAVHLNKYGSLKVTDYLVEYAIKNYNIPIHKNDPKYASWDNDYLKYERAVNTAEIKKLKIFNDWYDLSNYDNYTILISSNGDNVLNRLPQDMKDKFATLGLNKFETDKKNQKYAAIIDDGKVFFEEISDKKVEYKGRMNNKVNLLVSSENKKATINVSGKPKAKNRYGINFVIYDKVNREIVDSIWLDPSNFNQIRR